MALESYRRKRDFGKTPEPAPSIEKKDRHRFVIQKHHASQLHFDFRLEMDGVLKSWAVPKGPSLDPADKRLAMQVEDHPVSYFHFEGIIPEDNYGAGTVMVWDTGTWQPLGKASEMLATGDLKFRLRGRKLNGEFVLAKMRSRRPGSKGTEWLLIKKRDEFARADYRATDVDHDWSVLTNRSLEQILDDAGSAQWQSGRVASPSRGKAWLSEALPKKRKSTSAQKAVASADKKPATAKKKLTRPMGETPAEVRISSLKGATAAPLPRVIQPMQATLVDLPFDDADWLFEVKFDGFRALAFVQDGAVRLVSRNQNDLTVEFPELKNLAQHVRAKKAVIDGEICALDAEGRPSFSLMQQRSEGRRGTRVPIVFYAFDLLYADGYSLMRVDLEHRKAALASLLQTDERYRYSEHFREQGISLFKVARQKGLEGIVAKRRAGSYVQKRSRDWLKIKITRRQECVIGGFTEPRGSREHFGSLVLGLYDDRGRLVPVGQAGSGFTHASHQQIWQRLKKLEVEKSPFASQPESSRGLHFVRPELVAEIKFMEWTHAGKKVGQKMRAPVFQGLRNDKSPRECRFEMEKSAHEEAAKAERGAA